jgi:hypothetical protein
MKDDVDVVVNMNVVDDEDYDEKMTIMFTMMDDDDDDVHDD